MLPNARSGVAKSPAVVRARLGGEAWLLIAIMVGLSTVGAMTLFMAGLQKLRPWEVSVLSTLELTKLNRVFDVRGCLADALSAAGCDSAAA